MPIRRREGKRGPAYQVSYKDQSGRYRYKTFARKRAASKFESRVNVDVGDGTHVHERDSLTVDQALDLWLKTCEFIGRKGREPVEASTLRKYRDHARHIRKRIGTRPIVSLSGPEVQRFANGLVRDVSRLMAAKILISFKSCLTECRAQGYLKADPASGITISVSSRHRTRVTIPEVAEVQALLAAADELSQHKDGRISVAWKRYRPMVYTMALTGMRPSEVRGLPWTDIRGRDIHVTQRADELGGIGPPKSAAGERIIPIPERLVAILEAWRPDCPKGGLVFPNRRGRPESLGNIHNRAWAPVCAKAKLVKDGRRLYSIYSLRHFYASMLIDADCRTKELQDRMGHSDPALTIRVYGHLFKAKDSARAERVEFIAAELLRPTKSGENEDKSE